MSVGEPTYVSQGRVGQAGQTNASKILVAMFPVSPGNCLYYSLIP